MSAEPKPTLLQCAVSFLVIASCGFAFSAGLALLMVHWNPCTSVFGFGAAALMLGLGVQQFRGTFWRNSKAALWTAVSLAILGGLICCVSIVSLGGMPEFPYQGQFFLEWLLPMSTVGVLAIIAGYVNWQWHRQLKEARFIATAWQFSLRDLFLATTIVAEVLASVSFLVRGISPQFGENVSRETVPFSLPAVAEDISYCQGMRGTLAFEFTTTEGEFIDWVHSGMGSIESQASGTYLREINRPVEITCYSALHPDLSGPHSIVISKGLYYHWFKEDRGVEAVFDRSDGRAYFYAHFH